VTPRGTLVMLAIAAALAVGVWMDQPRLLPAPPTAAPRTPALLAAAPAATRLEWQRESERLTLVQASDGWRDALGHRWPAGTVEGVLEVLASLHPHAVAPGAEVDLAEYGLAPARERLRVLDDTGRELLALDIGDRNPAWTGVYARRAGDDEVLLVGALLRWELDKLRSARESAKQP
jgi:hypothetical protein